jgi:hypothetical protein
MPTFQAPWAVRSDGFQPLILESRLRAYFSRLAGFGRLLK